MISIPKPLAIFKGKSCEATKHGDEMQKMRIEMKPCGKNLTMSSQFQTFQFFAGLFFMKISTSSVNASGNPLSFRPATIADAAFVAQLVNSAYRGDTSRAGWTTEADLLTGERINADEMQALIASEDTVILLCLQGEKIIGSVQLQKIDDAAYLGMFVVQPTLQGGGVGKQFMQAAEDLVQKIWGVNRMWMSVISVRHELIAYYERRGYQRTGHFKPFPYAVEDASRHAEALKLEELEKRFN